MIYLPQKSGIKALLVYLLLIGYMPISQATVLFDGFGAGDSFEQPRIVSAANSDVVIDGDIVAQDSDWALAFTTPDDDYNLTSIEIALSSVTGANEVEIFLLANDGGLPGSTLESWLLSDVLVSGGSIHTLSSALNPLLSSNTRYWVEMSAGDGGLAASRTGWNSSTGTNSLRARQFDEGAWSGSGSSAYGWRVNGELAAIPEPSTIVLLSLGLVGLGFTRRKMKA